MGWRDLDFGKKILIFGISLSIAPLIILISYVLYLFFFADSSGFGINLAPLEGIVLLIIGGPLILFFTIVCIIGTIFAKINYVKNGNKSKSIKILIIFFVSAILIIFFVIKIIYINYGETNYERYDQLSKCDNSINKTTTPKSFSLSTCYRVVAIKTNNYSICAMINDSFDNTACYLQFSIENKNSSFCKFINDLSRRDSCYRYNGDCDNIINDAILYNCYESKRECVNINNSDARDDCFIILMYDSEDSQICNSIVSESKRDKCVMTIASKILNIGECEVIKSNSSRINCYDLVYYGLAIENQNKIVCEKIQDDIRKSWCYSRITE